MEMEDLSDKMTAKTIRKIVKNNDLSSTIGPRENLRAWVIYYAIQY